MSLEPTPEQREIREAILCFVAEKGLGMPKSY